MSFKGTSIKFILLIIIAILNLGSYYLYYSDKQKAKKHKPRIPEKTLLLSSILFGGLGAWLGMRQFRHKTKHLKFKILVPISALFTVLAIYFVTTVI